MKFSIKTTEATSVLLTEFKLLPATSKYKEVTTSNIVVRNSWLLKIFLLKAFYSQKSNLNMFIHFIVLI